jgi:DNA-binding beta-propeller fold protein YncE
MRDVWVNCRLRIVAMVALILASRPAGAQDYQFRVVASGLSRPVGIAVEDSDTLYFTRVPTPGVAGGANSVSKLDLETGVLTVLHQGEPEPTNIALDHDGNIYWTCKSAGVILEQDEETGMTRTFLAGLAKPTGIAVDRQGLVYFTEVPTPGVAGGSNKVLVSNGSVQKVLHAGEPEPTDIVVSKKGEIYWTCRSAGVILEQENGITRVLLSGLDHPSGIALDKNGKTLFFTEVPTPGVPGSAGGRNKVWEVDLKTLRARIVHEGDPEPTDVAVAKNGNVYWTCTSAGVIVEASPVRGR